MIKDIIDVIGTSRTFGDLLQNIDQSKLDPFLHKKFMFKVEGFGRSIKREEQVKIIDFFEAKGLKRENVSLQEPEVVFQVLDDAKNNQIIFGRQVASSRNTSTNKTFFAKYDLNKRLYLGPTSTDHELAFLMANQGLVSDGDLVLDPFVGTGSIAIACSHMGA